MVMGGNSFKATDGGSGTVLLPVSIDGAPVLAFILRDGHLLISLNVFDEFNQAVLQIKDNQLVQSVAPWDIKLVGKTCWSERPNERFSWTSASNHLANYHQKRSILEEWRRDPDPPRASDNCK